ncbi:MAG: c-type cytochrome [Acidobacteria bacterium]|nr:c-type cytochrome [Acidobacteriota bacterium]
MSRIRRRRAWGLLLGFVAILSASCSADKKPSKLETTLATMAKDVAIPIQAKDLRNPLPPSQEVVQEGQAIFGQACAICHGADGRAQTELGRAMYPPAIDLTSPHVRSWSDAELFWIIQNGIRLTGMPAWKERISEEDTWKLIHFLRSLSEAATQQFSLSEDISLGEETRQQEWIAYGRLLYRQEGCFMCHQLDGEGGTIGPDLTVEGTRGRSDEWLVGHFKDPPAYTKGSIMPSFKNLTEAQVHALVVFLQNQKGNSNRKDVSESAARGRPPQTR